MYVRENDRESKRRKRRRKILLRNSICLHNIPYVTPANINVVFDKPQLRLSKELSSLQEGLSNPAPSLPDSSFQGPVDLSPLLSIDLASIIDPNVVPKLPTSQNQNVAFCVHSGNAKSAGPSDRKSRHGQTRSKIVQIHALLLACLSLGDTGQDREPAGFVCVLLNTGREGFQVNVLLPSSAFETEKNRPHAVFE